MIRKCKNCKINMCEEFSDFCGPECMTAYLKEHKLKRCTVCGNEFYTQKGRNDARCERCIYEMKMARPRKRVIKAEPGRRIDDVIKLQKRYYEDTGRWLSYGQIVAKMDTSV